MTPPNESLAPNRRGRKGQPAVPSDYDDDEIARGTTSALLGALGRMQLKLDVLTRQNEDALARLEERLIALDQRLTDLTMVDVEPEAPGS